MFTDKESFKQAYLMKLIEGEGVTADEASQWDKFNALVGLLKEKMSYYRVINKKSMAPGKTSLLFFNGVSYR